MSKSDTSGNYTNATLGGLGTQSYYDPNRSLLESQIQQELYGQGSPTGSQVDGSNYGTSANPYSPIGTNFTPGNQFGGQQNDPISHTPATADTTQNPGSFGNKNIINNTNNSPSNPENNDPLNFDPNTGDPVGPGNQQPESANPVTTNPNGLTQPPVGVVGPRGPVGAAQASTVPPGGSQAPPAANQGPLGMSGGKPGVGFQAQEGVYAIYGPDGIAYPVSTQPGGGFGVDSQGQPMNFSQTANSQPWFNAQTGGINPNTPITAPGFTGTAGNVQGNGVNPNQAPGASQASSSYLQALQQSNPAAYQQMLNDPNSPINNGALGGISQAVTPQGGTTGVQAGPNKYSGTGPMGASQQSTTAPTQGSPGFQSGMPMGPSDQAYSPGQLLNGIGGQQPPPSVNPPGTQGASQQSSNANPNRMPISPVPHPNPPGVIPPRPVTPGNPTPPATPGTAPGPTGPGLSQQRDATGQLVFGGLSQMLNNPGIPQRVQQEIQNQAMQTANATYAGSNEAIQRNAAATGNTGGTAAAMAQNARNQAGTYSDLTAQNDIAFQQEAERQKETALSGLSNQYGQQSSNYNTLLGIASGLSSQPVATQTGTDTKSKGIQTSNTGSVSWT